MLEFNATFIIALLSFAVFILIMNAIFYRPILAIIRKREDYINTNYEESKRFEADANEYKTTHLAKIEQTKEKCRHEFKFELTQAQDYADNKIKAAKENSKIEAAQRKEILAKEEAVLKEKIEQSIVKELASSIASKILGTDTKIDTQIINR